MSAGPDPAFAPQAAAGVAREHDGFRLSSNDIGGGLPLPSNSGLPESGVSNLSKSDTSDFDGERAGVRGYGLSSEQRPSPDLRSLSSGGALRRPVGKSTSPHRGEVKQHSGK